MTAKSKAITAHALMLLNLLFPVVFFLGLSVLWFRNKKNEEKITRIAVNQAFWAAFLSTLIFLIANGLIIFFAQYKSTFALITFEVYFVFIIPLFLIPGLLGLVKSNADIIYYYPVIGRWFR